MEKKRIRQLAMAALPALAALLIFAGCAGSSGGSDRGGGLTPVPAQPAVETGQRKVPDFPPGKYTVQLGAYQSQDGAEKIAALTKSRFTKEVYTVFDNASALYKVMLGVFDTKDQARSFRDTIVRQYPDDYKDAWVSDLTK